MSRREARAAYTIAMALMASSWSNPVAAQNEPVLADLRQATSREGLRLGMLIQVVLDPSLDGDDPAPASVEVAAMRLLLNGQLDGGFDYSFQTNFAASPAILDARVGWSTSPAFACRPVASRRRSAGNC